MAQSQRAYIEHLNDNAPSYESDEWIMGGKRRERFAQSGNYGGCLKTHDPIAFNVSYRDWVRNQEFIKQQKNEKRHKR